MSSTFLQISQPTTELKRTTVAPAKALISIVNKRLTGRLTIGDPNDPSVFWRVYFGNGEVHFASSAMGHDERLPYLLQWYYPELKALSVNNFASDYDVICHYWQTKQISLQQARKLLVWLTEEAFVQLLSMPQATLQFEKNVGLDPILLSMPLREIVLPMKGYINQWAQLNKEIGSPFRRPIVQDLQELCKLIWPQIGNLNFIKTLINVLKKQVSLYKAAALLKIDVLSLATILKPAIKNGLVSMSNYQQPVGNKPIVACIDDSKTIQRSIQLTLEAAGYQVLQITQPTQAISVLSYQKPALILLDINMPEINGYELCKLLKTSSRFKDIPVIMLTGRDGIVDRLRAKMAGANSYLTKPFKPQQLLDLIEHHSNGKTQPQLELQPSWAGF